MTISASDRLAPVDVLVIEFPDGELTPDGFRVLLDLVQRDVIHVLDLELVRRRPDGDVALVDLEDEVRQGQDVLSSLVGASSGLLDQDDVAFVGEQIDHGSLAAVLMFEHVWLSPLVDAIEAGRARVVAAVHVDADALSTAIEDRAKSDDSTEGAPA